MEVERTRLRPYGLRDLNKIPELQALSDEQRFDMRVVGSVLPFRTNQYVVEELIDWSNIPNDPLFQLTFMQREMLEKDDFDGMADLIRKDASDVDIQIKANEIRMGLNPHPAGQMEKNVPQFNDHPVPGLQHKYRETALVFPTQGQTCFAYCTFCFRWPQFVDMDDVKFATDKSQTFLDYLREHKEITDVLVTGGDPMIMSAKIMDRYLDPVLFVEPLEGK